jgi:hypothetical protein
MHVTRHKHLVLHHLITLILWRNNELLDNGLIKNVSEKKLEESILFTYLRSW